MIAWNQSASLDKVKDKCMTYTEQPDSTVEMDDFRDTEARVSFSKICR